MSEKNIKEYKICMKTSAKLKFLFPIVKFPSVFAATLFKKMTGYRG